jgi:dihydrofolate reductase
MRKLITTTFMTLDGVVQAPGGPEEDETGSFSYGGWSAPYWDDAIGEFMDELMGKPFDLVLGRKTYDIFASFWPNQSDDAGGKPLNEATKYVASRGNPELSWDKSVQLTGDVVQAILELKQGNGPELQIHGSGNLIQSLLGNNVIDEMRVITYPVVLGTGKRLFEVGAAPTKLEAIKTTTVANGVTLAVYKPAGTPEVGSFG